MVRSKTKAFKVEEKAFVAAALIWEVGWCV